jgi:ring-1,2-phenylacetyl-CoA epoxidase subunit PaaE
MSKFYPLKIKDIRRETDECVSIALDVPSDLQAVFAYKSGQYLTFRSKIDEKDVRRSYSICSSPLENEWRVAVKKVENGVFSTFANLHLKRGDVLNVMPPSGHFVADNLGQNAVNNSENGADSPTENYVFFAAGSGITPVISHIKTLLRSHKNAHCTLIYGNKRTSSIVFREDIEALKNQFMSRLRVVHILSRERTDVDLLHGRLDEEKIAALFEKMPDILRGAHFFICGPEAMTLGIKATLIDKNINAQRIHFELFGTNLGHKKSNPQTKKTVELPTAMATIKLDGITFDVPILNGNTVLDAALEAGADLPYACKGGVCCTCRAKLIEGKIEMAVNYSLTEEEVTNGFILTCQAVPLTERIVVDFDVK